MRSRATVLRWLRRSPSAPGAIALCASVVALALLLASPVALSPRKPLPAPAKVASRTPRTRAAATEPGAAAAEPGAGCRPAWGSPRRPARHHDARAVRRRQHHLRDGAVVPRRHLPGTGSGRPAESGVPRRLAGACTLGRPGGRRAHLALSAGPAIHRRPPDHQRLRARNADRLLSGRAAPGPGGPPGRLPPGASALPRRLGGPQQRQPESRIPRRLRRGGTADV